MLSVLFAYKSNLYHFDLHSISDSVCCQYCFQTFPFHSSVLLHHAKSCDSVERPDKKYRYVCLMCKYAAYDSHRMRRHLRTHTGEKPFRCMYCMIDFGQVESLNRHIQVKHINDNMKKRKR
uniref:Protein glass n=1 Tax=Cacopsylla melanoneura TaxID=428564 RepID=A0A8D8SIW6_9HEMI